MAGSRRGACRRLSDGFVAHRDDDPFVPLALGERFRLRTGLEITVAIGQRRPRRRRRGGSGPPQGSGQGPGQGQGQGHRGQAQGGQAQGSFKPGAGPNNGQRSRNVLDSVLVVEGIDPEVFRNAKPFDQLTSIDPQPRLSLEYPGCPPACRLIDLFCPIGRGQRGLIVSPPKAGKTTLLKDIATSLVRNHPQLEVILLLVDERPEEVTDFKRSFAEFTEADNADPTQRRYARCRVVASSNDHDVEQHIAVATGAIERAKRMVECGRHVVIMMDSLTRLGRAFNRSRRHASSGRTMTGGIDSRALEVPKQIFGSARCTEEAGSLTIIASCLVDTGSQGDQVIFEEFKGTGNMELILDRKIAERRLFPAINLAASGTRKEHLLMSEQELKTITALRRRLLAMQPPQQIEQLLAALQRFPTNAQLVGSAG
ncbi:MAG: transcription termination factor Rho [Phycisphaerales bacterium]|nr:transcription termination factor Rho [Phycisphaerales bacterium]